MTSTPSPLILVVDDYQDGREMYAEYLTYRGFRVHTADSGEEAIRTIVAEIPSLVLMDIGMRGLTGTDTMRLLRDRHLCDGVPILALTGFALESETTQALADDFDAVIPKPCFPEDLVFIIRSILDGESISGSMPPLADGHAGTD
jgi:two-component system, cell cycle response regulator DivK